MAFLALALAFFLLAISGSISAGRSAVLKCHSTSRGGSDMPQVEECKRDEVCYAKRPNAIGLVKMGCTKKCKRGFTCCSTELCNNNTYPIGTHRKRRSTEETSGYAASEESGENSGSAASEESGGGNTGSAASEESGGNTGSAAGSGESGGGNTGSAPGSGESGGGNTGSAPGSGESGGGSAGSAPGPGESAGGSTGSAPGPGESAGGSTGSAPGPGESGGGSTGSAPGSGGQSGENGGSAASGGQSGENGGSAASGGQSGENSGETASEPACSEETSGRMHHHRGHSHKKRVYERRSMHDIIVKALSQYETGYSEGTSEDVGSSSSEGTSEDDGSASSEGTSEDGGSASSEGTSGRMHHHRGHSHKKRVYEPRSMHDIIVKALSQYETGSSEGTSENVGSASSEGTSADSGPACCEETSGRMHHRRGHSHEKSSNELRSYYDILVRLSKHN